MGLEIHIRYAIAWVWATVTLVIMIAGAPCPWYEIKASAGSVTATEDFYLDYYELSLLGSTHSCKYSDSTTTCPSLEDNFKTMWALIMTCVIVAIVVYFIIWVVLIIFSFHFFHRIMRWRYHLRYPIMILNLFVIILCLGAWCLLFWFPKAACGSNCSSTPDFVDDNRGPVAGWALYIVSFVFSIVSLILIIIGGPVDSGYKTIG